MPRVPGRRRRHLVFAAHQSPETGPLDRTGIPALVFGAHPNPPPPGAPRPSQRLTSKPRADIPFVRAVGIRNLNARLSEYVRLAASGETVLVTDHDRVVAELAPPSPGRAAEPADALLADAVRRGWISPPVGAVEPLPERRPVAPLERLLDELALDRADR
jgi:antitoxin (DNA-binding transcriptional repressor) of toxin-antitoxin stability system